MKYKIGDKVKIKTWDQTKNKYGLDVDRVCRQFNRDMEKNLNDLNTNRVVTIEKVYNNHYYFMKEINLYFTAEIIEKIIVEIHEPIYTRFEILDL